MKKIKDLKAEDIAYLTGVGCGVALFSAAILSSTSNTVTEIFKESLFEI